MKNLNIILILNTVSCVLFGSLFVMQHEAIHNFLQIPEDLDFLVPASGGVLLLFAAHLISAIVRKRKIRWEIYYFVIGDILWVLYSALLIIFGVISGTSALLCVSGVAILVGTFALLQFTAANSLTE